MNTLFVGKFVLLHSKKRVLYNRISEAMLSRLLRRVTAVCAIPSQSTELAKNIRSLLALGVAPSALPMVALKKLMWRPGVLATPSDLDAWAKIAVLHGSTLRAALEGFASSDTPISSHFVACRLLKSCISLHACKNAVKYLARHLRDAPPATFTASQCIAAIGVLAAYIYPDAFMPPRHGWRGQ